MNLLRRFLHSRIATICLGLFLIGALYQTVRVVYKSYATDTQIHSLQSQIDESIKKGEQLVDLQKLLQSDFFAEREARVKLGMQKQGEFAVIVSKNNSDDPIPETDRGNSKENLERNQSFDETKNPTRWWNFFFAKK